MKIRVFSTALVLGALCLPSFVAHAQDLTFRTPAGAADRGAITPANPNVGVDNYNKNAGLDSRSLGRSVVMSGYRKSEAIYNGRKTLTALKSQFRSANTDEERQAIQIEIQQVESAIVALQQG